MTKGFNAHSSGGILASNVPSSTPDTSAARKPASVSVTVIPACRHTARSAICTRKARPIFSGGGSTKAETVAVCT